MKVWSQQEPGLLSWCPLREESRLFADATPEGTGSKSTLSLKRLNFVGIAPNVEVVHTFSSSSPFTAIDWSTHQSQSLGYIAAGQKNGQISLYSPEQKSLISTLKVDNEPITDLEININQTAAILSVSGDNNVSVWDVSSLSQGKNISSNLSSRLSTGEITGATWHRKANCFSIFAVCDSTGLTTIWDIRVGRITHSFADSQFKFPLSDVVFSPTNMAELATASSDPRNSVVLVWDIRNTGTPVKRLHGHSGGVTKIEWPAADDRVIISSGKDGKVIAWDVESGSQLTSVFEPSSIVSQIKWSPFIPGAILSSTQASKQLYSFADISGSSKTFNQPRFQYVPSGVDVAFDGKVFQYNGNTIKTFLHQEDVAEINDFVEFVEALENKDLKSFVDRKTEETKDQEVENGIWKIVAESMSPQTFKESMLKYLGVDKSSLVKQVSEAIKEKTVQQPPRSSSEELFGVPPADDNGLFSAPAQDNGLFGAPQAGNEIFGSALNEAQSEDENVFGDVFQPFNVLPEKDEDEATFAITQALISGDFKSAVDCAFESGKFADAIVIASCGPQELFEATRQRYLKQHSSSPLIRLVSDILGNKLDNYVRYAKVEDWKEIFAVLCNFAKDNFQELAAYLGRRIISELNNYNAALICFVAAHNFEMIQQCLFQIYEQQKLPSNSPTGTILVVLEKICAMAGDTTCDVIAPLARSFLQHIVQSGHKEEAIRFLKAVPSNRTLDELKKAIIGEPQLQQPKPVQQAQSSLFSSAQTPSVFTAPAPKPAPAPVQVQQHSVFVPNAAPAPQPVAPVQQAQPGVFVPQQSQVPQTPSVFKPGAQTSTPAVFHPGAAPPPQPAAQVQKPRILYPTNSQPNVNNIAPQPYIPKKDPSAVPPPNSNDPRQKGRPTNYIAPPPPKMSEIQQPQVFHVPGAESHLQSPIQTPSYNQPVVVPGYQAEPVAEQRMYGPPNTFNPFPQQVQQQTVAPPPPPSKAHIVAPPTINIVAPRAVPQQQTSVMTPTINAPPAASAVITAPPPMQTPVYQIPSQQQVMAPGIQVMQQPEPVQQLPDEASIEDVPEETQVYIQGFIHFIEMADAREEKTPQVKKAIADAKQKLPYVNASFRDGEVPEELQAELTKFFEALDAGDIQGASTIRKAQVIKFMSKCRNVIMLMNYLQNALA